MSLLGGKESRSPAQAATGRRESFRTRNTKPRGRARFRGRNCTLQRAQIPLSFYYITFQVCSRTAVCVQRMTGTCELLGRNSYLKEKKVGSDTGSNPEEPHRTLGSTGCFLTQSPPRRLPRECESHDGCRLGKRDTDLVTSDATDSRHSSGASRGLKLKWPHRRRLPPGTKPGTKILFTDKTMRVPRDLPW